MSLFNYKKRDVFRGDENGLGLAEALDKYSYQKIIINLGINDVGYPMDSLISQYEDLVEMIKEKQPDASIIVESIMTVGREKEKEASYFKIDHIADINEQIRKMATRQRVYYIDENEFFADEEGYLPGDSSWDGCHLTAEACQFWVDWLCRKVTDLRIKM